MNINATLIAQAIMFALFFWFCKSFVWTPIINTLAVRQKNIADGIAAAFDGKNSLELAAKQATESLNQAKLKATEIITQAENRAVQIIDEAKGNAKIEGERILIGAKAEIEQELNRAKESLRGQVSVLAVAGAEKILRKEIDGKAHSEMLAKLAAEL